MRKVDLVVLVLYLFISMFFLRGILVSPGMLVGNDWGLPATPAQMQKIFYGAMYTWTNNGNLFGSRVLSMSDVLFSVFIGFFSLFQVSGEWLSKGWALFLLTASGFAMYYLCHYLKFNRKASFLAGLFYITTPPFFNYLSMGWAYVLMSFALLPIGLVTFEKSVKQRSFGYGVVTAFIFYLALFQFQALMWFIAVFFLSSIFLITSRERLRDYFKSFSLVLLLNLLFGFYWIIAQIFFLERSYRKAVSLYDFGRFGIRLNLLDMLRLRGSVYNIQFETALPSVLVIFTFLLPICAYLAVILMHKNRYVLFFAILSIVPSGIFLFRNVMLFIPYSALFRDYSRYFILSAFAYSALLAFTIDELFNRFKNAKYLAVKSETIISAIFVSFFIGINILVSYPFWSNDLSKEAKSVIDTRLRMMQFPEEYQRTEKNFSKMGGDFKTLWLPTGAVIVFLNGPETSGSYGGAAWDVFANFSSKPGQIMFTDRENSSHDFAKIIETEIYNYRTPYLADILKLANIRYLIVRLHAYSDPTKLKMKEIYKQLENDNKFQKVFADTSIVVFENTRNLPHIYPFASSTTVIGGINDLAFLLTLNDFQTKLGIFLPRFLKDKEKKFILRKSNEILVTNTPAIVKSRGKEHAVDNYVVLEDGRYEILVKPKDELKNKGLKTLFLKTNGVSVVFNAPIFRTDSWISLGNFVFKKGGHRLSLYAMDKKGKETVVGGAYIVLRKSKLANNVPPKISFKKINPTRYQVKIENTVEPFFLVFSESYHPQWKAYIEQRAESREQRDRIVAEYPKLGVKEVKHEMKFTPADVSYLFKNPVSEDKHFLVNGYANAWYIDPAKVDKDRDGKFAITLYFWPQSLFYLGLGISLITLIGCIIYLMIPLIARIVKRGKRGRC